MTTPGETIPVDFAAADEGQAQLTWGQLHMWRPLQAMPASSSDFNLKRSLLLPQGVALAAAVAALRGLIERHQTLRAHLYPGEPAYQRIERSGQHAVLLVDAPTDGEQEAVEHALRAQAASAFTLEHEWPARFVLVGSGGAVRAIGLVMSHACVDAFAFESLLSELRERLAGVYVEPTARWQPLDQARFEASPAGQRRSQKSLAHIRRQLALAPAKLFARAPEDAGPLPIRRWRLDSDALALAASVLAARTRTTTSTVLLTVSALLLRAVSRHDTAVLKIISSNRFSAQQKLLTAGIIQDGFFVCQPKGDLLTAIARTYRDATEAYASACYDPDGLSRVTAELRDERGTPPDVTAYFNDARLGQEWPEVPSQDISRGRLDGLRAESGLTATGALPTHDMTFYLAAGLTSGRAGLSLLADTRLLPSPVCERILRGAETVLCEGLSRPVDVDEIGDLTGL